ncbi:hydratase [Desulfovibrio legallii]|uniref:Aconitate hydratase n=1 Tax=Desulfovibrio legallii TaxID=571438 RepID=A0A1G7LS42_9BACT|nr:hydratase [Desulfovibrio legallii]SDF52216.1 aconitate hydratase [Desulfovibrio legallii]
MIELVNNPVVIDGAALQSAEEARAKGVDLAAARSGTLAARILDAHNTAPQGEDVLRIRFDALASHDITYVGIIQTARASGLKEFPLPYALTNCHNSLCAVGGTINEDDHLFGLAAARKYGGIFVPPNLAVIHQYVREMMTKCGGMILGSDSHTRYGALGVMGVGEGGPELVKQLLGKTYDLPRPQVVAVWLEGAPRPGVGPQDVALALIGAVFKSGFVKNKVLEFMGPGVANLSVEYRCGVDVMTTETTCLSSIWTTDEKVRAYLRLHGREADYAPLQLEGPACYEACIRVDLSRVVPMIALPFHPSNAWPVAEVVKRPKEILAATEAEAVRQFGAVGKALNLCAKIHDNGVWVDQGVIAGCAGGSFENITLAAAVLNGKSTGNAAFSLSVYPASEPQGLALVNNGSYAKLMAAGAVLKNAFCGPCFGAGDTPAHGALSIRHATRNFPNREGSKPASGQLSAVALMDARSIAATAANGGRLTPATELDWSTPELAQADLHYRFEPLIYHRRVYNGFGRPEPETPLVFGPNIADWPSMSPLPEHLLLQVACVITDPVTTTDELIPSGETSSLRSNPPRLAEYTLSRKDPGYVARAKAVQQMEKRRLAHPEDPDLLATARALFALCGQDLLPSGANLSNVGLGSTIFALKPGDGSAREQAASCQKVLGGWANLAAEYATKRYRSNLINWGMLPFIADADLAQTLQVGDWLAVPHIRSAVQNASPTILAYVLRPDAADGAKCQQIALTLRELTADERQIILDGCLINFYNAARGK